VTEAQFTTLENSPPELLFQGDAAFNSYEMDTWGLGLCIVHLLTGSMPYEEIMEEVRCPDALARQLAAVWGHSDKMAEMGVPETKPTCRSKSKLTFKELLHQLEVVTCVIYGWNAINEVLYYDELFQCSIVILRSPPNHM